MIDVQLRVTGGRLYPRLRADGLREGLEAAHFVLTELRPAADWWIALRDTGDGSQAFPTVHVQRVGDRAFLQFYAGEDVAPDREEGWMTLACGDDAPEIAPFRLLDELAPGDARYFAFGPGQGVAFSTRFLCPAATVADALTQMRQREPVRWAEAGNWVNLGLI